MKNSPKIAKIPKPKIQMNNEDAIYEDMEDFYFYEDFEYSDDGVDYDMNFDKVTVFSHVNAPSGQR